MNYHVNMQLACLKKKKKKKKRVIKHEDLNIRVIKYEVIANLLILKFN